LLASTAVDVTDAAILLRAQPDTKLRQAADEVGGGEKADG
jgi:hypothetical protein